MSKSKNRYYWFSLMSYLSEENIKSVLSFYSFKIRQYAFILHDKDVKDNGDLVEPHYHIVIYTNNAMTCSAVLKLFEGHSENTFIEVVRNKSAINDYLIHKDKNEKYQYPVSDITYSDKKYFDNLSNDYSDSAENTLNICLDLIDRVPYVEMIMRYGRDFVINYKRYSDMADLIKKEL